MYVSSASKDSIEILLKTDFHVRIGDFAMKTTLHIAGKLVVNIVVSASFIGKNILGIYFHNQKSSTV